MNATYDLEILKLAKMRFEILHAMKMHALGVVPQPANVRAQWEAAILERTKRGMKRSAAIVAAMKERPDIRQAYDATAR